MKKRGKVIIQTKDPDHWVSLLVADHDYIGFYNNEIIERKNYHYPPFYKIINLTIKHKDLNLVELAAHNLADALRMVFKERVLGPEFPLIQRIHNQYLKEIKLKIERGAPEQQVKKEIHDIIDLFFSKSDHKKVKVVIDVDPL